MYLFHITSLNSMENILKDGYLKPNILTDNINFGEGLYKNTKFIFFSVTNILYDSRIFTGEHEVILYFNDNILYKKKFYLSTQHGHNPKESLFENGDWYTRKYNKYTSNYRELLNNLYEYSINVIEKYFFIYQQIALRTSSNIKKNVIGIEFVKCTDIEIQKILKLLNKNYPNIDIKIRT